MARGAARDVATPADAPDTEQIAGDHPRSAENPHAPNWRAMGRVVLGAALLALVGAAAIVAGAPGAGAALILLAVAVATFVTWIILLVSGARDSRRNPPSREAALRNSYFGFVSGLLESTAQPARTDGITPRDVTVSRVSRERDAEPGQD
jgi:hypothetical protein